MSIIITKAVRIAGSVVAASGTPVTYSADLEADLVSRGCATYAAGSPSFPGKTLPLLITESDGGVALVDPRDGMALTQDDLGWNSGVDQTELYDAVAAAETAAAAALVGAGVYATEAAGRAAVADGVAFKVQGAGDVAAYEYRRTSASASTLIASYPAASAVEKIRQQIPLTIDGITCKEPEVSLSGGAVAITRGLRIPSGQTGQNSQLKIFVPLKDGDIAKFVGQPIRLRAVCSVTGWYSRTIQVTHLGAAMGSVSYYGAFDAATSMYEFYADFTLSGLTGNPMVYISFSGATVAPADFEIAVKSIYLEPLAYHSNVREEPTGAIVARRKIEFERRKLQVFPNNRVVVKVHSDPSAVGYSYVGRRAIQDAIDSIVDATADKQYEIQATGEFYATQESHFDVTTAYQKTFISGKDFVHVVGIRKCKIIGYLASAPATLSQAIFWNCRADLENVEIYSGANMNYGCHIEGAGGLVNIVRNWKNVRLHTHTGVAIGYGASGGEQLHVYDSVIDGGARALYLHNNKQFGRPTELKFTRCALRSRGTIDGAVMMLQSLGSGQCDCVTLDSCSIADGDIAFVDSGWSNDYSDDPDHAEYRLIAHDLSPRPVSTLQIGMNTCLKFASKSTGASSTVRFDSASSAFSSIIGDPLKVAVSKDRYLRDTQYGYSYVDGSGDVGGLAFSGLDLLATVSSVHRRSLGKRLGDCSTVNKTLTVIVDGTSYNVVFNKNYDGTASNSAATYTNAQIISEIVAVVGAVCDVSMYGLAVDYYPDFDGVAQVVNADSVAIRVGMGYVLTGVGTAVIATSSDAVSGIALDTIAPGKVGRGITKGQLYTRSTGQRFALNETDASAKPVGTPLGINAATPGVFSTDALNKTVKVIRPGVVEIL